MTTKNKQKISKSRTSKKSSKKLSKNQKKASNSNITNVLKEMCRRKFPQSTQYRMKHLKSMIPIGNSSRIPKFWDDKTMDITEQNEVEWMAGVEVHLHKTIFALYGRNERDHRKKYLGPIIIMKNNPKGYMDFNQELDEYNLKISRFLMETTGVYHFPVAWHLQDTYPESEVIAMNAKTINHYMPKTSKNDKADAVRIAQVAQLDDFITKSYIPEKEEMALRELLRQRGKIMRENVRLMNTIKKVLASGGFSYIFNFKKEWEMKIIKTFMELECTFGEAVNMHKNKYIVKKNMPKFENWLDFNLPYLFKANVLLLMGLKKQAELNLEMAETALMHTIEERPPKKKTYELLEESNGIGILSAIGIMLESGDIQRFNSVGHYLSYCGISPSGGTSGYENESSEKEKVVSSPKPNRHSNHNLKRIYVNAAGSILNNARHKNSKITKKNDMVRYSERYINDKRKNMKLRFKIAAKLARRVFYCLKTGQKYDPTIEYKRALAFQKGDVNKIEKKIPKRKRQAWADRKIKLLKNDMDVFLTEIVQLSQSNKEFIIVKNHFEDFMRKYEVPSGAITNCMEVSV